MKKTMKTRITAAAMALIMVVALSATAFADGPQGSRQRGGNGPVNGAPQGGMQMPQGGFDQGAPQGGFGQDQQMSAGPQIGRFDQNGPGNGQQPPEKPEGDEDRTPPADGQQPPEKPEGENMTSPEKPEEESLPKDDQGMFRLFQQFLEWLKGNKAE
ncbi:MAG: hypothetical protein K6C12_01275 [Oscillospiraceae bacterium]|nr:hypothetical protein [Oscillospiraceae bacterium]